MRTNECKLNDRLEIYLNARLGMLSGAEKESAIHKRVSVENKHLLFAEYALDTRASLRSQGRQYEAASVVISVVSFIFHLEQKK